VLADPASGVAWQADWISFDSPAVWPGHQTLRFPETQRLSYFDQTLTIDADAMTARLDLHPGFALALDRMELTAGEWQLRDGQTPLIGAASLVALMVQTDQPETYQFDVDAGGFTPGPNLRQLIHSTDGLPETFDALKLDMTIGFDRQWDISALEQSRPQPLKIDVKLADVQWGALRILAAGTVTADARGYPLGAITIKADNWREMLAMAEASGAMPTRAVGPAEKVLGMLAGLGGNPNALDVQLNFRDGFVALGPFPLGPVPQMVIR